MKSVLLSFIILVLVGCTTTPPAELITQEPVNDISVTEVNKSPSRFVKSLVRWGGRVVKSKETTKGDQTQLKLEVLAYPLDQKGKPVQSAESLGVRFIANLSQPYKKLRYYRNRWITVTGIITGSESYTLASGEEQPLPVVDAQEKYAWREEYRDDYYYDHYWWPRFYIRYGHRHRSSRYGVGVYFHPRYINKFPR